MVVKALLPQVLRNVSQYTPKLPKPVGKGSEKVLSMKPDVKIGIIISNPYYDNNYTYNDWICYDEPIYDIQFPDEKRTGIPQNFLTKIKTKEKS